MEYEGDSFAESGRIVREQRVTYFTGFPHKIA